MNDFRSTLSQIDPEIAKAIGCEIARQNHGLELIASENFVSRAVLEALGSALTNKYAEGYPGKRYYGGCQFVDQAEELAIARAKKLFGADYVNVQPHSGSQANMAVYFSVLQPGDTILSLSLAHGGHLTHGHHINFSGKFYKIVSYGVDSKTHLIDMNQVESLAKEHRPKMIVVGASAYSRKIEFAPFKTIAAGVGAYLMADIAHPAGLIAAKLHPDPVPHCDFVTTTTHKTLRGPRGGMVMCKEAFEKGVRSTTFPGIQGGPLMHVIAAKAVAFHEALQPSFKKYCQQVITNAQALAKGLIDGGYNVLTGGTDNHCVLLDLRDQPVTGKEAEEALGRVEITVNKNMVPFDPRPPMISSGIRLGTPALTSRGMQQKEMTQIAAMICSVLRAPSDESVLAKTAKAVAELSRAFPLYPAE